MNPALIALASSLSWGSSDFLGGLAARRISPYQAVALAHAFSLACLLAAILYLHIPGAGHSTMAFGLVAGLFGGFGLMLFYRALSLGNMGLTAALGGVLSAAVPVIFSLLTEGLPSIHQLLGFGMAILAIWIIASSPGSAPPIMKADRRSLWMGVIAGTCFGIYFVLLKEAVFGMDAMSAGQSQGLHGAVSAGPGSVLGSVLWSITFSRITSSMLALLACAWMAMRNRSVSWSRTALWNPRTLLLAVAIGLLDMGGNLLYTLAARLGRMDVAAVLSSLYPAVTIVLAVWILKERTTKGQTFGMALALAAVGLIST